MKNARALDSFRPSARGVAEGRIGKLPSVGIEVPARQSVSRFTSHHPRESSGRQTNEQQNALKLLYINLSIEPACRLAAREPPAPFRAPMTDLPLLLYNQLVGVTAANSGASSPIRQHSLPNAWPCTQLAFAWRQCEFAWKDVNVIQSNQTHENPSLATLTLCKLILQAVPWLASQRQVCDAASSAGSPRNQLNWDQPEASRA